MPHPRHPPARWLRLAVRLQDRLVAAQRRDQVERARRIAAADRPFLRLLTWQRQLDHCLQRGWDYAAEELISRIRHVISEASFELNRLRDDLHRESSPLLTLADLIAELDQLDHEFTRVEWAERGRTLTVETEPITLEDTELGPFAIVLDLHAFDTLRPRYHIDALDPHPAAGHEHVIHPHVSDRRLCEGDATHGIAAALRAGRLCDFFLLVRQVLRTYNPNSPYVTLRDWDREGCYDCNYRGDLSTCDACDQDFCEECCLYDELAERTVCRGCSRICHHDDHRHHPDVIAPCDTCGESFCTDHLDEHQVCGDCREAERQDLETPDPGDPDDASHDNRPILDTATAAD